MRNKQRIKRCPMCGGKAGIYQDYHSFYLVQCNRCGISTLHRADLHTALYEWNRRVSYDGRNRKADRRRERQVSV